MSNSQSPPLSSQLAQLLFISCSLLIVLSGCSGGKTSDTTSGVIETIVDVDKIDEADETTDQTDEADETTDQISTMFVLPSLIALTPDKAKKQLRNSGHIGETTINYNGKCSVFNELGNIYRQDPSANSQVDQSSNVIVYTGCFSMKIITAIPNWGGTTTPPDGITDVKAHNNMTFSVFPEEGNSAHVEIDGETVAQTINNVYTIQDVITDHIVMIRFDSDIGLSGDGTTTYTITTTVQSGDCSISPSGNISVSEGSDQTFTISVNSGTLSLLQVDGTAQQCATDGCDYTFTAVSSDHTMEVLCL